MGFQQGSRPANRVAVKRCVVAAITSSFVLMAQCAFADNVGSDQETHWGIGLGVTSAQTPYIGVDRDNTPIPLLQVESQYLRFFGTGLEVKLPSLRLSETQRISFGLIGRYDGAGYESDDSWALEGMQERKGEVWAGARVAWQSEWFNLHADWTHDISGHSQGQQLKLGANRTWKPKQGFSLTPRIAATWQDGKYVDYYYGVRASEARAGRSAYQGESGLSTEIGLLGVYNINKHHSVMLDLQATRLSSEIKNSPLVDSSTENRVFLGYLYHF